MEASESIKKGEFVIEYIGEGRTPSFLCCRTHSLLSEYLSRIIDLYIRIALSALIYQEFSLLSLILAFSFFWA